VVRAALLGAHQGTQGLRDRAGAEAVRPGQRSAQVVLKPRRRFLLLPLGTGAGATGRLDTMVRATPWALREAVAVVATAALWDGVEGLAVPGGERGRARQGLGRAGDADRTEGGHGRRPGLRVLRRSEASSWPLWVRGRESIVAASGVGPRERGMSRGLPPASSRGVAEAWRRGGMAPPMLGRPARCVAVRQAPWTRERRRGEAAVGLGV
jgi:hypothetical protein